MQGWGVVPRFDRAARTPPLLGPKRIVMELTEPSCMQGYAAVHRCNAMGFRPPNPCHLTLPPRAVLRLLIYSWTSGLPRHPSGTIQETDRPHDRHFTDTPSTYHSLHLGPPCLPTAPDGAPTQLYLSLPIHRPHQIRLESWDKQCIQRQCQPKRGLDQDLRSCRETTHSESHCSTELS